MLKAMTHTLLCHTLDAWRMNTNQFLPECQNLNRQSGERTAQLDIHLITGSANR